MVLKFTTEVEIDSWSDGIADLIGVEWIDIESIADVKVKWEMHIETKEWGIKSFTPILPDQKITLDIEYYDKVKDDYTEVSIKYDIKNADTDDESNMELSDAITPHGLEIDEDGAILLF